MTPCCGLWDRVNISPRRPVHPLVLLPVCRAWSVTLDLQWNGIKGIVSHLCARRREEIHLDLPGWRVHLVWNTSAETGHVFFVCFALRSYGRDWRRLGEKSSRRDQRRSCDRCAVFLHSNRRDEIHTSAKWRLLSIHAAPTWNLMRRNNIICRLSKSPSFSLTPSLSFLFIDFYRGEKRHYQLINSYLIFSYITFSVSHKSQCRRPLAQLYFHFSMQEVRDSRASMCWVEAQRLKVTQM